MEKKIYDSVEILSRRELNDLMYELRYANVTNDEGIKKLYESLSYLAQVISFRYSQSAGDSYYKHIVSSFMAYVNNIGTTYVISDFNKKFAVVDCKNGEAYICDFESFKKTLEDSPRDEIGSFDSDLPMVCLYCGKISENLDLMVNGYPVCSDCVELYDLCKCEECGLYSTQYSNVRQGLVIVTENGETTKNICYDCGNKIGTIIYCTFHHREECCTDYVNLSDGKVCVKGFNEMKESGVNIVKCDCCHKYTVLNRRKRDLNGKLINACEACRSNMHDARFRGGVEYYSYKPRVVFTDVNNRSYVDKGNMFFGVELEVDGTYNDCDEIARGIHDMTGNHLCYCKHDGSLTDGIELVTHPMSFDFIKSYDWGTLFDYIKDCELDSTERCGFHVHTNRNALGESEIERDLVEANLICLFDLFYDNLVGVGRREPHKAREWAEANHAGFSLEDDDETKISKKKDCSDSRYHAVNLTNTHTVEIRLWASTLNPSEFVSTLFITKRIIEISKNENMETLLNWDWNTFKSEIQKDCPKEIGYYVSHLLKLGD